MKKCVAGDCGANLSRWFCCLWLASLASGCSFDQTGVSYGSHDGAVGPDANSGADAAIGYDSTTADAQAPIDAAQSCTGSGFECLPAGKARVCEGGHWVNLGECPLGCDPATRECRVPSNVPADWVGNGAGAVSMGAGQSPITIDTDTGEITTSSSGTFRPAMTGLHVETGIWYGQIDQSNDEPGLGVFALDELTIGAGSTLVVQGDRALVLLVTETATVSGTILATADGNRAGPGGFDGGQSEEPGEGPCGGKVGYGEQVDEGGCASGSGGGGYGGAGGDGGDSTCGDAWDGGDGGDTCGLPDLVPLAGGSGGAGGHELEGGSSTHPGHGGGGGGAIQITAGETILLGTTGGINAGGGGGGECTGAGGAGGGAGGAVLLEAPSVQLAIESAVAANGGGGGGGDCT